MPRLSIQGLGKFRHLSMGSSQQKSEPAECSPIEQAKHTNMKEDGHPKKHPFLELRFLTQGYSEAFPSTGDPQAGTLLR